MTEAQKVLHILIKSLREQRANLVDQISTGAANSYDVYKELCGRIHGLSIAEQEAQDLLSRLEQNDD